jgi:hypothetical protein
VRLRRRNTCLSCERKYPIGRLLWLRPQRAGTRIDYAGNQYVSGREEVPGIFGVLWDETQGTVVRKKI